MNKVKSTLGLFLLSIIAVSISSCNPLSQEKAEKKQVKEAKTKAKKKVKNGLVKSYYPGEGKILVSEVYYTDGLKDGKAVDYYKNGQIRLEGNYANNKKDGLFTWYREDGKKYKRIEYYYGEKHGWDTLFYKSGKPKRAIPYTYNKVETAGTTEWDYYHKKKPTPKIKLREVNRIDVSSEYLLFASFKDKIKADYFEIGYIGKGTKENPEMPFAPMNFIDGTKTEGMFSFPIKPGYQLTGKLVVKAKGKTKAGNPFVTYQVFPVVMR